MSDLKILRDENLRRLILNEGKGSFRNVKNFKNKQLTELNKKVVSDKE